MSIGPHIATGLILGKITNNYPLALAVSLLIDIDHLFFYIRHKIIFSPKKIWRTAVSPLDPHGSQRNYLHSLFAWFSVSFIFLLLDPGLGLIISSAYILHLLLDALDKSDFLPLYPLRYSFIGPVKYLSKGEFLVTSLLLIIFFVI